MYILNKGEQNMKNVNRTTLWQWTGDRDVGWDDIYIIEKSIPNHLAVEKGDHLVAVKILKNPNSDKVKDLTAKKLAELVDYSVMFDEYDSKIHRLEDDDWFQKYGSYYRTGLAFKGYEIFHNEYWSNNQMSVGTKMILGEDNDAEYTFEQAERLERLRDWELPNGMYIDNSSGRYCQDDWQGHMVFC